MKNHFYSIIVPFYNRKDEIQALLESFQFLNFPVARYELILVDDGSMDDISSLIQKYLDDKDINLIYLSQRNLGPGAARNLGMKRANGTFLIFIDSDCTVDPNWLKEIDRSLQETSADAFGGPDSYRDDFPPLLKAINYSMTSFLTTGGIRGHKNKKLGKFYPRSFNMGLNLDTYRNIGGFGQLRHGQDIEFSNRIIKTGAKVIQIDKAIVYHKRRTSIKKFFKQVFNWSAARINLFLIDKSMLEPVHVIPAVALLLTIALFFIVFVHPKLFIYFLFIATGLLLISALDCWIKYRSLRTALLVIIIIPIQIYAYGLGFTIAFVRRVILKHKEFIGFKKNYYR